ncbi:MAG: tRNA pseudouridine(38-40) synthase TruA [Rhodospirillales bacterium]|nr:tRNA pseudouridine(38-40) synthase TruA [Rhodospirillales bacterium]
MPRYKITIEYDGTGLVGWQRQDNGFSVQQALEQALAKLSPREEPPVVYGAGRTDAGVHALGQVAHFDLKGDYTADKVRDGINYHIRPNKVSVLKAEVVDEEFNSRFDANERAYLYRILNRRPPAPLKQGQVWEVKVPLDATAMHEAAQVLVGNHDFTTFRASVCQAQSPVKTLDMINITEEGEEIHVRVRARSFLHHQVRNIVGTLKLVGEGNWTKEDVKNALEAKNRIAGGPTAPAYGLYLTEVVY